MTILNTLIEPSLGTAQTAHFLKLVALDPALNAPTADTVPRAHFAIALNIILLAQLLERVPTGAAYVADIAARGDTLVFDHGALRTIKLPHGDTGALPAGERAFRRILEPLGYADVSDYPLPKLKMMGRAYCHADFPSAIPQYFLSELFVDQLPEEAQAAAQRVFGASVDPLDATAHAALKAFTDTRTCPLDLALAAMPTLVSAFDRQHPVPALADYQTLKAASAEAAWIATEGNAFNHATDRVAHVEAVAEGQRALGRAIKDRLEVSASGRVRQTAFRADWLRRDFVDEGGSTIQLDVPGSFFEFISRDVDPATGALDLAFDSGNATGIFAMTKAVA
jgi:hypothetical protein